MRFLFVILSCIGLSLSAQNEIKTNVLIQFKDKNATKEFEAELLTTFNQELVYDRFNIHLYTFANEISEDQLMTLANHKGVLNAQYEHRISYRNEPNDPLFGEQWNMLNDGSGGGKNDADIDADLAWENHTGGVNAQGDTMVIAIVDGGFELAHEDINYFTNTLEIPDNGIDDDGNGYVDDVNGWNAYDNNGDMSYVDLHGTHVAGISGAIGNNNKGVAGVCWNAKIMPIAGSSGEESVVLRSYGYIFDMKKLYDETKGEKGALIVATNSSFGVDQAFEGDFPLWCAFYDSLGSIGILNSVAVPNNNVNIDAVGDIPGTCASDYMIAVTNLGKTDVIVSAGTGNTSVDLGAPGNRIMSTIPENFGGNFYDDASGTSMAAPHIAGAVAYLLSASCDSVWSLFESNPAETALMIKRYIYEGVDQVDDLQGETKTGGRLNLNGAYDRMYWYCDNESFLSVEGVEAIQNWTISPNPSSDYITVDISLDNDQDEQWQIFNSMGQLVKSSQSKVYFKGQQQLAIPLRTLPAGLYYFHWQYSGTKAFIIE